MPLESTLYIAYSCISLTITVITAILFWKRRNALGAKVMVFLMLYAAQWVASDLFAALATSMSSKLFWDNFSYLGIVTIPIMWLSFSFRFSKQDKYLTRKNLILLHIIPFLTLIMIWTNDFHHLFEVKMNTTKAGLLIITDPVYGIGFWISAFYSYILIIIGTIILLKKLVSLPKIYRQQSIIMILGVLFPIGGSILYLFGLPSPGIDTTVFSFTFTGVFFFRGMFRYKLFELVPAARGAVIESMNEFVMVLDTQNRIIDINTSAQKMSGESEADLIGQSIFQVLNYEYGLFEKYVDMMDVNEKVTINQGNQKKVYDFRIAPLYKSKNKLNGRFIIMRDITILEEAIEDLEKSRKIEEDANKAKSEFLATMSHEIRTPINGIIGMAELLTSANLTKEERDFLESIQYSADSLLEIINDILDFSKIEAGKMLLEKTIFNFKNLMENIFKSFLYKSHEKNLEFINDIDNDIPENLMGDPMKLRQVLVNLIGNSLKFTESGNIQIKVKNLRADKHTVLLQFSVLDTGVGIPADKIDTLFKSFQQLDSSTTRKFGGTGLGLAIAKNLVTIMGGQIKAESKLGEGSKFSFKLSFQKANIVEALDIQEDTEIDFQNKDISILLAEDNKVNQLLMVKLFERKNIKVEVAENGNRVLEKLRQNHYDLILMDVQMPEMDGYETTLSIRRNENHSKSHIPIIALTANVTQENKDRCIQAGMDDYLSKPITSVKLFSCLKKYVK